MCQQGPEDLGKVWEPLLGCRADVPLMQGEPALHRDPASPGFLIDCALSTELAASFQAGVLHAKLVKCSFFPVSLCLQLSL